MVSELESSLLVLPSIQLAPFFIRGKYNFTYHSQTGGEQSLSALMCSTQPHQESAFFLFGSPKEGGTFQLYKGSPLLGGFQEGTTAAHVATHPRSGRRTVLFLPYHSVRDHLYEGTLDHMLEHLMITSRDFVHPYEHTEPIIGHERFQGYDNFQEISMLFHNVLRDHPFFQPTVEILMHDLDLLFKGNPSNVGEQNPIQYFFDNFSYHMPGGRHRYDEPEHWSTWGRHMDEEDRQYYQTMIKERSCAQFDASPFRQRQSAYDFFHVIDWTCKYLGLDFNEIKKGNQNHTLLESGKGTFQRYTDPYFLTACCLTYAQLRLMGYSRVDLIR